MTERTPVVAVRDWNRDDEAETRHFARLLAAYHRATEREKHAHFAAERYEKTGVDRHYVDATPEFHTVLHEPAARELPEAYRSEVSDPRAAFAGAAVLLAHTAHGILGCAVLAEATVAGAGEVGGVRPRDALAALEVKRLWVEPAARGHGLARMLVGEAIERADGAGAVLRLSVWKWRDGAIRLYERLGFTVVPSWDTRPDLLCLERSRP